VLQGEDRTIMANLAKVVSVLVVVALALVVLANIVA
jgi:hypothetical protein